MGPGYEGNIELIKAIQLNDEELERFKKPQSKDYQRVRVYDTPGLEAIVSYWKPGDVGPIHNYNFQQGWLKIMKGSLSLDIISVHENEKAEITTQSKLVKGEIAMLNDGMGFHRFANYGQEECIVMHIYADKILKWKVFDEETQQISEVDVKCNENLDV
jgi:predicted metal-dependent enzyme (double-stranded beta helix superfamily)